MQSSLAVSSLLLDTDQQKGTGNSPSSPSHPGYLGFSISHQKPIPRNNTGNTSHETDLLRHFRYHVGPWIDTGDSNCAFGVQVLLLSRSNRSLQSAILALSAGQRLHMPLPPSEDVHNILRFRKEATENLTLQPDLVRCAGQALLLLQEVLPAGLQRWRDLIMPQIEPLGALIAPTALNEELGEALFWLYFRLGK